ncbi:MAG: hypothetical protein JOZ05_21245, partial [Acetobacteraceae bacterium]|nr:hypothetical protein [Acetobacteraceae bacterium]
MSYAAALRSAVRRRSERGPGRFVLPALFLFLVVPMLVFSALIVPTAEVPDEVAHIVRANSLLHGVLIGHRVPVTDALGRPAQDAVVAANPALVAAGFAFPPGSSKLLTRERLDQLRN